MFPSTHRWRYQILCPAGSGLCSILSTSGQLSFTISWSWTILNLPNWLQRGCYLKVKYLSNLNAFKKMFWPFDVLFLFFQKFNIKVYFVFQVSPSPPSLRCSLPTAWFSWLRKRKEDRLWLMIQTQSPLQPLFLHPLPQIPAPPRWTLLPPSLWTQASKRQSRDYTWWLDFYKTWMVYLDILCQS